MTAFPDGFLEEINSRIDLLELVSRFVALKKSGANWQGLCPFHEEKTPSFSVRPDRGFFKCFGCGAGGDAIKFLMLVKRIGFSEAVTELAEVAKLPLPRSNETPEEARQREERQHLFAFLASVKEYYRQQLTEPGGRAAREYCQQRGLSQATIDRFELGFAPSGWRNLQDRFGSGDAAGTLLEKAGLAIRHPEGSGWYDRFRDRLLFPIHDIQGRCVAFGGRVMRPGELPKYINSPETPLYHKGEILYGLDKAREAIQREERAVVVEGYMDLIALSHSGVEEVVATLGTSLTSAHLRLLWRNTRRLVFCFDGDNAGRKAAWRALEQVLDGLEADRHIQFLFLPDGEDPDQTVKREGAQGFRQRLSQATSLLDFLFSRLKEKLDLNTPEGKAAVYHRAKPYLDKVADTVLRDLYYENLRQRLSLSGESRTFDTPIGRGLSPVSRFTPPPSRFRGRATPPPPPRERGSEGLIGGRNYELALLALLLHHPWLLAEHEEALNHLELENGPLAQLLLELIRLGNAGLNGWPLQRLSSPEVIALAEHILAMEEATPEPLQQRDFVVNEFKGCFLACQRNRLQREMDQALAQLGQGDDAQLERVLALRQEHDRLLRQRQDGLLH